MDISSPHAQPPSTGGTALSSDKQYSQKRNRTQLSCTNCRHSKLKCDRNNPCSQCTKRGRASLCAFPVAVARRRPAVSMHNRLKHLESLVKDVMTSQMPVQPAPLEDTPHGSGKEGSYESQVSENLMSSRVSSSLQNERSSSPSGQVLLGTNESTYVGATHWAAILDDIEEVKTYFEEEEHENSAMEHNLRPYTSLFFSVDSHVSKRDILATLPQRFVVDRLVSRYFNSNSPALFIIHRSTFQKEYRKFWDNPEASSIAWLALLFAVMTLAVFSTIYASDANLDTAESPRELTSSYQSCCIQCLILSNYTKPGLHTIQALCIYMEGEFLIGTTDEVQGYLLVGNIVRLALRMGLHRDPTNVGGNITPFQSEMRRRIWHHLIQIDLLASFHIGLPGMVPAIDSDTLPPRNLRDEDFGDTTTDLPPSRPESEITPMSYALCKSRLCKVAGKIVTQANLLSLPAYDEVMKLDVLLRQAYDLVPPFFRQDSSELSLFEAPSTNIKRLTISLLFQKSRCMLHRKFMMKGREHPEFTYSKTAAIDASMQLLNFQSMVHDAVIPGGQLAQDRWFLSSITLHDFLLAAMIVYMSILQSSREEEGGLRTDTASEKRQRMTNALERSHAIWKGRWIVPAESKRAAAVLAGMLKKVNGEHDSTLEFSGGPDTGEMNRSITVSDLSLNNQISYGQAHGSVPSVGPWPIGITESATSSSDAEPSINMDLFSGPIDPLSAMIEIPNDFDWEAFDSQVRPQHAAEEAWPDFMQDFSAENDGYYI